MLQNDFILPISFNAAQNLGLEESVLLAFLEQHSFILSTSVLNFELGDLSAQLPFWTSPVLLKILSNLQTCDMLQLQRDGNQLIIRLSKSRFPNNSRHEHSQNENARPHSSLNGVHSSDSDAALLDKVHRLQQEAQQKGEQPQQAHASMSNVPVSHAPIHAPIHAPMPNTPVSHVPAPRVNQQPSQNANRSGASQSHNHDAASSWPRVSEQQNESRRGVSDFDLFLEQQERTRQPDQWLPEEATLEQISQAGIPRQFAVQLQAEFLLRIKEQRKNVRTWNSEFFKYVKRQWQYKQADRSSYEGTQSSTYHSRTSKEQVSDALTNIHDTDW